MSRYIPLNTADMYFRNERPDAAEWDRTDADTRRQYLNCAGNVLVSAFLFPAGRPCTEISDSLPDLRFGRAVCEEALHLMQNNVLRTNPNLLLGISSVSIGPLAATFSHRFGVPLYPDYVRNIVETAGGIERAENNLRCGELEF